MALPKLMDREHGPESYGEESRRTGVRVWNRHLGSWKETSSFTFLPSGTWCHQRPPSLDT